MTDRLLRATRVAGACAMVALSVFSAAATPAEACFMKNIWLDDCTMAYNQICSYNSNGSGGLYVASSGLISIC